MKALTIKQPMASAIFLCGKNVENRTRRTNHRGAIAIHAGAAWSNAFAGDVARISRKVFLACEQSAIIGTAELIDCIPPDDATDLGPWAIDGYWHWLLSAPYWLSEPVPCGGKLGLWDLPADVDAALAERLGRAA